VTPNTIVSTDLLEKHLDDPGWIVFDCRFSLDETERGLRDYRQSHIPGALYVHLNRDLSGVVVPGRTGRHPPPDPGVFTRRLAGAGLSGGMRAVAYDDASGAIAARLWWMLKWLGHDSAAILDGGWLKWLKEGRPVEAEVRNRPPGQFEARRRPELELTTAEVRNALGRSDFRLLDARAGERYRGEVEPIDPVAGHIPGALSAPFEENLEADGTLRSPEELRARYLDLLGGVPSHRAGVYCGSGVTAAHNILACEIGGLAPPRLYAGSWSEWITDPRNPVSTESPR
jgi:thiosulfate/3-mercaptopyruvate sulfurtransferase